MSDRVTCAVAKGLHKGQQPIEEVEQLISGVSGERRGVRPDVW